jgi:ABC-type Mn2+/Zn2+ transport system permease subunit
MARVPDDLLLPLAMAAAAGLIGSITVMRRMTLASDAISHVALPGIGIAILVHANPTLGGLAALFLGTLLVWTIEYKTRIPTEAVIGVVFSAALAVGGMLMPGQDLIEALFGAPRSPASAETLLGLVAAIAVIVFALLAESRLVITLVSPDLARTAGIDVARINLLFLLAFALTVALGLQFLGVLLMGSLIIIPAATAKYLARSLRQMRIISVAIAMLATVAGTLLAPLLRLERGPLTIVVAATLFFASLMKPRHE